MIDFLTNLAARSQNRLPVLQPRLASLFEPARRENQPQLEHSLESDWSINRTVTDSFEPRPWSASARESQTEATLPDPLVSTRAPTNVRSNPVRALQSETDNDQRSSAVSLAPMRRSARATVRPEAELERNVSNPVAEINPIPTRAPAPRLGSRSDATPRVAPITHGGAAEPGNRTKIIEPAASHGAATDRPAAVPRTNTTQPAIPAKSASLHAQAPQLAIVAERSKPLNPQSAESHPIVRVTIGRIEVRAIVSPAPARTRERESGHQPQLALDEYLKRRNGGAT